MHSDTQRKLAEKEINGSVLISAGCGAIPVAYIDIAATIAVQTKMIHNLCEIYEVKWDENIVKSLLGSVLGNLGKRMGASMVKSIPLIGPILGGAANAVLSGVSTYAMGHAFIKYMSVHSTVKSVKDINVPAFGKMYDSVASQTDSIAKTIREKIRKAWNGEGADSAPAAKPSAPKEKITVYGERAFGTKEKFHAWLNRANPLIKDRKPIELLLSDSVEEQEQVRRLIDLHLEGKKAKA